MLCLGEVAHSAGNIVAELKSLTSCIHFRLAGEVALEGFCTPGDVAHLGLRTIVLYLIAYTLDGVKFNADRVCRESIHDVNAGYTDTTLNLVFEGDDVLGKGRGVAEQLGKDGFVVYLADQIAPGNAEEEFLDGGKVEALRTPNV